MGSGMYRTVGWGMRGVPNGTLTVMSLSPSDDDADDEDDDADDEEEDAEDDEDCRSASRASLFDTSLSQGDTAGGGVTPMVFNLFVFMRGMMSPIRAAGRNTFAATAGTGFEKWAVGAIDCAIEAAAAAAGGIPPNGMPGTLMLIWGANPIDVGAASRGTARGTPDTPWGAPADPFFVPLFFLREETCLEKCILTVCDCFCFCECERLGILMLSCVIIFSGIL